MSPLQIVFILAAALILGSAVMVVSSEKLLHSALWLILSLFGVAILYALLQAGFFAVVQVLVYIGAIAILVIFAIMLTRRLMQDDAGPQLTRFWWVAALAAIGVYAVLVVILRSWPGFLQPMPDLPAGSPDLAVQIGQALTNPNAYALPFEVASVLLLAALIGAIYIARERNNAPGGGPQA